MIPPAAAAPTQALPPGTLPPWANTLQLTAIVKYLGRPHAVIRNKTDRKEYRYVVGSTVSNTMGAPVTVVGINATNETVTLASNDQTVELALRVYRISMFAPFGKRYSLFGDVAAVPTFEEEAPPPSNLVEAVTVPETYERPLGNYAEAQMKTGIIVLPVDQYVQRRYRLERDYGLLVYNLQKLGIAEKAGLLKRDIITAINNKRVDNRETFTYVLNEAYKAEMASVPVTIVRNGKEETVYLKFEQKR
jgi:membrane-associated protease RseP (regulator of RpoE activity)